MTTLSDIAVYLTARDTSDRLTRQPDAKWIARRHDNPPVVIVDPRVRYQTIEGFGGAFTEAASTTWDKLPKASQEEVLTAYFDAEKGLGYTMGRVHINSSDFSCSNYALDDVEGDFELKHFSLQRDQESLIPFIKAALAASKTPINIFASPWSPPGWMKTNGEMNHGGKLKEECRDVWARYYARFIKEYAKEGIPIWGLTIQNEPAAVQAWDSCIYTGAEERDFLRDHLGPTLVKEGLQDVKVMIWDHNRDILVDRAKDVLDDPEAAKYVWGVGFHWYGEDKFENVQHVHDLFPDKKLMLTEACVEMGPSLNDWGVGERYAHSMVNDLNRWAVGWVEWNLLLDELGGPNHVLNYCCAPIIGDTRTGQVHYMNSYYYIGHFSKFIRPGAVRISSSSTREFLETTAFLNTDGSIAVVVLNRKDSGNRPITISCNGMNATVLCPAHSISTLVFNA
jgi:glucosylceramidase